jgi:hypothetical protein
VTDPAEVRAVAAGILDQALAAIAGQALLTPAATPPLGPADQIARV